MPHNWVMIMVLLQKQKNIMRVDGLRAWLWLVDISTSYSCDWLVIWNENETMALIGWFFKQYHPSFKCYIMICFWNSILIWSFWVLNLKTSPQRICCSYLWYNVLKLNTDKVCILLTGGWVFLNPDVTGEYLLAWVYNVNYVMNLIKSICVKILQYVKMTSFWRRKRK